MIDELLAAGFREPVIAAEVSSTNAECLGLGEMWRPVLAELQVGGRGRLGRGWEETRSAGLALSVALPATADLGWMPLVAGVAVARALQEAGVPSHLKWPNDVLLPQDSDRKVCGILCELAPSRDRVVVGIGVNVDHLRHELPTDRGTSLRLAGHDVDRSSLAIAVLSALAEVHREWSDETGGGAAALRAEYRQRCSTIGAEVDLHLPDGNRRRTTVLDVDDDGSLRVEGASASLRAGDITHLRPAPQD